MKRSHNSVSGLYTICVTALFLTGFFLLMVFGAQIYRGILSSQREANDLRAQLSVLQTALRAGDAADCVTTEDYGDGQLLRIADGDTGYGLLIYAEDGQLLQEYTDITAQPRPDYADVMAQTDTFAVSASGDMLTVTTDAGSVTVHLRSAGGVTDE